MQLIDDCYEDDWFFWVTQLYTKASCRSLLTQKLPYHDSARLLLTYNLRSVVDVFPRHLIELGARI